MSDAGIIYTPERPTASIEGIATLEFDVLVDENHEWSNEITENPVENGAPVTDHIIRQGDKLRMNIMVSDSSLYREALEETDQPTQKAFDVLRQLMDARETVTVYTKYHVYDNMGIAYIGIPRSIANGNSLTIPIEFKQIRLVNTQTVKVPAGISKKLDKKSTPAVQKKTEPQKNTGAKQPVAPKDEKQKSVLSTLLGGA